MLYVNGNSERARVAIFISDRIEFKSKTVNKDIERHYVMIKGSMHQEAILIINIYALNITEQALTELKGERDSNNVIAGEFNILFSVMDRTCREIINKKRRLEPNGPNRHAKHSIQWQQNTHVSFCT